MNFTISSQLINAPFKPRDFCNDPGNRLRFGRFFRKHGKQKGKETVISLIDFHETHKSLDKHESMYCVYVGR